MGLLECDTSYVASIENVRRIATGATSAPIWLKTINSTEELPLAEPWDEFSKDMVLGKIVPEAYLIRKLHHHGQAVWNPATMRPNVATISGMFGIPPEEAAQLTYAITKAGLENPDSLVCVDRAVQPYIDRVMKNYLRLKDDPVEWWITVDPGRQYTASLNPRMEDPQEWYGDYYCGGAGEGAGDTNDADATAAVGNACSLCLDPVVPGSPNTTVLGCGHVFHGFAETGCDGIYRWFISQRDAKSCPMCRAGVGVAGEAEGGHVWEPIPRPTVNVNWPAPNDE
jgi:hypothetical protein